MDDNATPQRLSHVARFTFDDYAAMVRGLRRLSGPARAGLWAVIYLTTVTIAAGPDDLLASLHDPAVLAILLLPAVLFMPVADVLILNTLYRWSYRRQRNADALIGFDIGPQGVDWRVEGMAGHIDWATVVRFIASDRRMILYVDRINGLTMPRGDLDEAAWAGRVALVTAALPEKAVRRTA